MMNTWSVMPMLSLNENELPSLSNTLATLGARVRAHLLEVLAGEGLDADGHILQVLLALRGGHGDLLEHGLIVRLRPGRRREGRAERERRPERHVVSGSVDWHWDLPSI